MSKWNVVKDAEGNPTQAGFCYFPDKEGYTVTEYDDVDKSIVEEIRGTKKVSDCCTAMLALDPADSTGALKVVIECLQEKYG